MKLLPDHPWLLFVGDYYYPTGPGDFVSCHRTREDVVLPKYLVDDFGGSDKWAAIIDSRTGETIEFTYRFSRSWEPRREDDDRWIEVKRHEI